MQQQQTWKTDSQIKQDVEDELKWDSRVRETEVGVEVDAGVVTLTGTVNSWAKRLAAQEAAHRVGGVRDVANDLQVRLPGSSGRTDTEIAHAVRHALAWDVFVPESRIHSTISDGWVTLTGSVEYASEREDANRAVRNLAGVRGVTDKIEVQPPSVSAPDLRRQIEDALARQVQREAMRIAIDIDDGRVVLSGSVHSSAEEQAIVGAVRGTPGVRSVDDRLRIAF